MAENLAKGNSPNPDEVLKMVEAELSLMRTKRPSKPGRMAFRIWSLVFLFALVVVSLLVLQFMVSQLPSRSGEGGPAKAGNAAEAAALDGAAK